MEFLLEDGLLVNRLELGLEVVQSLRAAVGSSAGIGKVEISVFGFIGQGAPRGGKSRSVRVDRGGERT